MQKNLKNVTNIEKRNDFGMSPQREKVVPQQKAGWVYYRSGFCVSRPRNIKSWELEVCRSKAKALCVLRKANPEVVYEFTKRSVHQIGSLELELWECHTYFFVVDSRPQSTRVSFGRASGKMQCGTPQINFEYTQRKNPWKSWKSRKWKSKHVKSIQLKNPQNLSDVHTTEKPIKKFL